MIKTILKRNNILLSQFANDLNISRPTLDAYIKSFDKGVALSNSLYQKIFEFLFNDPAVSKEQFNKKYEYIIANYGGSKEIQSTGSSLTSTVLESIVNDGSIRTHLNANELNALGDLVVNGDALLAHLLKIDLVLSNKIDLSSLSDKEKMLTVGMYELTCKLKKGDYSYNREVYFALGEAVNKKKSSDSKSELKQKITDELSQYVEHAIDNDNLESIVKLLESLKKN